MQLILRDMKITNTLPLTLTILAITLFSVSAAETKTKLPSGQDEDNISQSKLLGSDGICTSMVKKHGYDCEENIVMCLHFSCFRL